MTWHGHVSARNRTLPADWAARRAAVLQRDQGRCYLCGGHGATEVDHIVPPFEGGNHELPNLAQIHTRPCHEQKSRAEAARAVAARRAVGRRTPEPHPGTIRRPT